MAIGKPSKFTPKMSSASTSSRRDAGSLEERLTDFVNALGSLLVDVTAVEVNTMIVERITGDKFIPWETYRDIFILNPEYLQQHSVHESLKHPYLELRKKLELEYAVLLTDPTSNFYDATVLETATDNYPILTDTTRTIHNIETRLPNPLRPTTSSEILLTQQLLRDHRFLRTLRKMAELKAALDNRNQALQILAQNSSLSPEAVAKEVKTDIIYAQSIMQLDGDILNRYSQELFDHPHKDLILQLHREGVMTGEKQWRGLLGFVVNMVQKMLERSRGTSF